jgi:CheY-like chemotaxis protein
MTHNPLPALPVTGRVLLVDDSEAVTRCVSSYLETYGHGVVEENSPFRAHATARRERPDVIVLDIKMPGRDGGAVLEQIREDPELRHTPVIFLTGLMTAEETGEGLERDGCVFLSKQAKFSILLRLVNRMLAARPAHAVA